MTGTNLAGTSTSRQRVDDDFYATPFESTRAILERETLTGSILEPACGEGHIGKVLTDFYPNASLTLTDLVSRANRFNLVLTGGVDFLTHNFGHKFDNVITNPPFCSIREFIERGLELANDKVLIFGKIQLLEGKSRKDFLRRSPLKKVYVFSERQSPLRNGDALDERGKPWASTMCFAWFVWQKGYNGEPVVDWL